MADTRGIRAGRAFVELGVSDKLTRGLRRAQARLRAFGAAVQQIGQRLVAVSASVGVAVGLGLRVFATFEQRMARTKALTGAAGKSFDELSERAQQLGATTVFSASQAADAMSFFALAGFKVDEILKAIGPTLNLAAAGQLEIAQAADIAAKIMAGMGLAADDLGRAVDVLTKAMTTANTDLAQLGDAMKFVGPIAKSAGIKFEEITAAIQLLSNAGIQGEMAGTTLRTALLSLTSPSEQARRELQRLGVSVTDAQGNVRPLADIIEDLSAGLAGMGSGARLDVLGRIFPARAAAGMAELLSQGAPRLRQFTKALRESGGTAARIAGVQLNTLTGNVTLLKSALEGLGISVGEALVAPLRVAVHAISKAVGAISGWVKRNRELVVIGAAAAVAIGAAGAALVALGVAAQAASFVFGGLASIVAGVTSVFGLAASAIGALLTPIGAVVAAVAGLGSAVLVYSGAAGEALAWLREQFGRLRKFVGDVVQGISDALAAGDMQLAAKVLWLALKLIWQQGVATLNRAWLEARRFFVSTAQKMWFGALAAAENVWHALEVAWIETTAFLSKAWTDFISDMQEAWGLIQNWLTKRWLDLMEFFGMLTEEQARLAKQMADQDFAGQVGEIERRRSAALAEREQRRRREREQARAEHEAALAEIGRRFEEAQGRLDAETDSRIAETRRQLAEARRELDKALADAKRRREEAESKAPGKPTEPGDIVRELERRLAKVGDALAGRVSVTGAYSAEALRGLGPGSAAERTARATEQTARNTKRLADAVRTGGLAFA